MKQYIQNYTFNKTAKTVTFNDFTTIDLNRVLLVVNVTDNIILFNFADPTRKATVSGNVLTLEYDTGAMENTDKLLIYYDDPTQEIYMALKIIANLISRPIWLDSTGRLKVTIDGTNTLTTLTTLTTVTTVSTLTSLTQLAGFDAKLTLLNSLDRNLWYNSVRNRIT